MDEGVVTREMYMAGTVEGRFGGVVAGKRRRIVYPLSRDRGDRIPGEEGEKARRPDREKESDCAVGM